MWQGAPSTRAQKRKASLENELRTVQRSRHAALGRATYRKIDHQGVHGTNPGSLSHHKSEHFLKVGSLQPPLDMRQTTSGDFEAGTTLCADLAKVLLCFLNRKPLGPGLWRESRPLKAPESFWPVLSTHCMTPPLFVPRCSRLTSVLAFY